MWDHWARAPLSGLRGERQRRESASERVRQEGRSDLLPSALGGPKLRRSRFGS